MIVSFHSVPQDVLSAKPPFRENDLYRLVRKAASLGFKAFQIGPLSNFPNYNVKKLRQLLDEFALERNVHLGGVYDAHAFYFGSETYQRALTDVEKGIKLCRGIASDLLAFHPPFFERQFASNERRIIVSKAKDGLRQLINESSRLVSNNEVRFALESFCYPPFIFDGLHDFNLFLRKFSPTKLGTVLEVGHLYNKRFDLSKAINLLSDRLFDVHVHDATWEDDFRKATHLPIGKGTIDFRSLIETLRRVNYDGWLTLEVRGKISDIVESKKLLERFI
jgi:sugar phosphate isomerase/epimerase